MTRHIDEFGDRLKAYEAVETSRRLDPSLPICVRIDGRSFSRFTRRMDRPFDMRMIRAMVGVTKVLVRETHARIGYTQSDEISLVYLHDAPGSEPLFGGKAHKLCSVLASLAASAMQCELMMHWPVKEAAELAARLPHFDARAFSVPSKDEAANVLLWRTLDARKNAVSMAASAHFSAKALHLKGQAEMRAMLAGKGIDFDADYPAAFREGSFIRRVLVRRPLTPDEMARIPEAHRPPVGALVTRSDVTEIDMPAFREISNRVDVIFDGAEPAWGRA